MDNLFFFAGGVTERECKAIFEEWWCAESSQVMTCSLQR